MGIDLRPRARAEKGRERTCGTTARGTGKPDRAHSGGSPPRVKHARALSGGRVVAGSRFCCSSPSSVGAPVAAGAGRSSNSHDLSIRAYLSPGLLKGDQGPSQRHVRRHRPGSARRDLGRGGHRRALGPSCRPRSCCRRTRPVPHRQRRGRPADRPADPTPRAASRRSGDHERRTRRPFRFLERAAVALRGRPPQCLGSARSRERARDRDRRLRCPGRPLATF